MSDADATTPTPSADDLIVARRELHAAYTLLGDPGAHPSTVRPHLDAVERTLNATNSVDSQAPARRSHLKKKANTLGKRLRELEAGVDGGRPLRRRRILWALVVALLVAGPIAVWVATHGPLPGRGPWRGAYFGNRDLEGSATLVRDDDVNFNWKKLAPVEQVAPDEFSVRWDTCLELEGPHEVVFQLSSDDGSRLFVEGEEVIKNWGRHRMRARSANLELGPGVHHLRVEYQDLIGAARVHLHASFAGEKPAPISPERLRYPGDEIDEADPCRSLR